MLGSPVQRRRHDHTAQLNALVPSLAHFLQHLLRRAAAADALVDGDPHTHHVASTSPPSSIEAYHRRVGDADVSCPPWTASPPTAPDLREYARALDCFVKGVVDVFLTDPRGKILLGHRLVHPQPDWWVLGGRMRAGDTPAETARRNAIRETRLDIAPERWEFVCAHTMLWQFRKQAPSGNGTADFGVIMHAVVTDEEVARMTMCNEEYETWGWFQPEELLAEGAEIKLHPVLRRGLTELVNNHIKQELHRKVCEGGSDAEIAALVKKIYSKGHDHFV